MLDIVGFLLVINYFFYQKCFLFYKNNYFYNYNILKYDKIVIKVKNYYWIALLFLFAKVVYGKDNYNIWYQYLLSAKLNKSNLTLLSQYRSYDLALDTRVFLVGGYYDYELKKNIKPAIGLMYLNLHPYINDDSKKTRNEIRPFQQITFDFSINKLSISNRFRIEERFLTNPDIFILRSRYLLSLKIPFNIKSKYSCYGLVKNEIRLNVLNDDFFDSDRVIVGVGYRMNSKSTIEIAYINQIESRSTNHYAFVGFRNQFDWRNKK